MTSRARAAIDEAYSKLRSFKEDLFRRINEFGLTGKPEGFDVDAELVALRERFAAFNQRLIQKCEADPEYFEACIEKCVEAPEGIIFWVDAFCYTFVPKRGKDAHIKIVLYPYQENAIRWIYGKILNQKNGMMYKSRGVGATWIFVYVILWFWIFTVNAAFLIGSRKEELVDGVDEDAIMPKIDYTTDRLPSWMLPPGFDKKRPHRKFKALYNVVTKQTVKGEATNEHFARGGRRIGIFIDEFPAIKKDADKIRDAAGGNADCVFFVGTPSGPGHVMEEIRESGTVDVLYIHWTDSPEYQEGRYKCEKGCRFHPAGGGDHSKRYDWECINKYHNNPQSVARELDMDPGRAAGTCVFDLEFADKCEKEVKERQADGRITLEHATMEWVKPEGQKLDPTPNAYYRAARDWKVDVRWGNGDLVVWKRPFTCTNPKCPCNGTKDHRVIVCCDTSQGLPSSDNNVAWVLDITSGQILAGYVSIEKPDVFAERCAQLGKLYGKQSGYSEDAYMAPEGNAAQGQTVCNLLEEMGFQVHLSRVWNERRKRMENRKGIIIQRANKANAITERLIPAANKDRGNGQPIVACPFWELYNEMKTFITWASTDGEINPEAPRCGAASGKKDDRVMALLSGIIAVHQAFYGKVKGYFSSKRKPESKEKNLLDGHV